MRDRHEPLFIRWARISAEGKADGTRWKVGVMWAGLVLTVTFLGLVVAFLIWVSSQGSPNPTHP